MSDEVTVIDGSGQELLCASAEAEQENGKEDEVFHGVMLWV